MSDAMPEAMSHKVAGLPAGAWLAIAGTGIAVAVVMRRQSAPAPAYAVDSAGTPGLDNTAPGAGNLAIGTPASNPTGGAPLAGGATAPATNEDWATLAQTVLFAKGYGPLMVNTAIRKYLNGDVLSTQESAVIGLALQAAGPPPTSPPPPMPGTDPGGTPVPQIPLPPMPGPARPGHGTPTPAPRPHPVPAPKPKPKPKPKPARHYTVQRGDSLWKIGLRFGRSWRTIYAANRGLIGANPNVLKPGQVLVIP